MLRAIWRYRGFVKTLSLSDLRVQSARAVWGYSWLVIEPAIQILIYVVIFSKVLKARLPGEVDDLSYSLYLCSGILAWNFFASLLLGGRTMFLENADLLRTVRFPRSTLPVALLFRSAINAGIPVAIFLVVIGVLGRWPGSVLLTLLPVLVIQAVFGISLAVLLGTVNVFFRDVGLFVGVALQFGFWLTPIVYPLEIVPAWAEDLIRWNPMFHFVSAYQGVIVYQSPPDWSVSVGLGLLSMLAATIAWLTFRTLSPDLVDEL